jgi:hypothetical protein
MIRSEKRMSARFPSLEDYSIDAEHEFRGGERVDRPFRLREIADLAV